MTEPLTYDLFVSYADADRAWVEGYLLDALEQAGVRYLSEAAFALGVPRIIEFERAIEQSQRVLLILSPAYLANGFMQFTDLLAQSYGLEIATWPVIPLILHPATLPPRLAMLTSLDATDPADQPQAIEDLCKALRRPAPGPASKPLCPYPGMAPFTEADSLRFFGRNREIQELLEQLRLHPFLSVIGPSGSGKSSLISAGLIPALRQSGLFGPGMWLVHMLRPGETPLAALTTVLGGDLADLTHAVAATLTTAPGTQRLLLIVDQFEEIFSLARADAVPFQEVLLRLSATPRCFVVLTIRADFYPDLMATPLWREIQAHRVEVASLDMDGLRQAIVNPAESVGVYVEAALVERLASDAAGEPGILPLVQETLVLLWERLERRYLPLRAYELLALTRHAYSALGGVRLTGLQVAMARRADQTLKELTAEQQAMARRIFLRLVQFGEGRADTRRQQPVAALLSAGDEPLLLDQTLRHLTNSRLLTLSGEEGDANRQVDIAHEALINGWPTLQAWVNERRDAEQARRRLEAKSSEWMRLGRSSGGLLDDVELLEAERWLNSPDAHDLGYDTTLNALVEASRNVLLERRASQRRAARFRWGMLTAVVLLIITALSLGLWSVQRDATNARQQAALQATARADAEVRRQEAERLRLAALARALAAQAPRQQRQFQQSERGALLARQAYLFNQRSGANALDQVDEALRSIFDDPYFAYSLRGHEGPVNAVAISPDGHTVASAGDDGIVLLWNTRQITRATTILHGHKGAVRALAFSPDGQTLASGGDDKTVQLWNLRLPGAAPQILRGATDQVNAVAFSPDGHTLAVGIGDPTYIVEPNPVWLWNLQADPPASTLLEGPTGGVNDVAFSPDGQYLAAVSYGSGGPQLNGVQIWDMHQPSKPRTDLDDNRSYVLAVAFSPDGQTLATGGIGGTVWLRKTTQLDGTPIALSGHEGWVRAIAFSPDGRSLASTSDDGTVRVWNYHQPSEPPTILRGHQGPVRSVVFSPDGQILVTGGDDRTVRLWRLLEGAPSSSTLGEKTTQISMAPTIFQGPTDQVRAVAFSADGQTVAAGIGNQASFAKDNPVWLWDIRQPTKKPTILVSPGVGSNTVAFSSNGHYIAASSFHDPAWVWDLRHPNREALTLTYGWPVIGAISVSPDGQQLATGDRDGIVRLWHPSQPKNNPILLRGHTGAIYTVAFSADGKRLASGGADRIVRLWEVQQPDKPSIELAIHTTPVKAIAFSTDGQTFASGGSDGVYIWNIGQAARVPTRLSKGTEAVHTLAFSPDGHILAATTTVSGTAKATVLLWNMQHRSDAPVVLPSNEVVLSALAFSADGHLLAVAGSEGLVHLWDVSTMKPITTFRGATTEYITTMAFSSDGQILATYDYWGTLRLWDLRRQTSTTQEIMDQYVGQSAALVSTTNTQILATIRGDGVVQLWDTHHLDAPPLQLVDPDAWQLSFLNWDPTYAPPSNAIAFSPDSRTVASGGNGIHLWDLIHLGAAPIQLQGYIGPVNALTYSPDGQLLVAACPDGTVRLWRLRDMNTAPEVLAQQKSALNTVAISPDNQTLVAGGEDGNLRLWDLKQPQAEPRILVGHNGSITGVAVSSNSRTLVSGSKDGTVRLWDLQQLNASPIVLSGHTGAVNAVAFSADGEYIASGSDDRTVRVWPAHTERLADAVCKLVTRNLTVDEWKQFIGTDIPYERTCPDLASN